jgi:hypothetical protein
MRHIDDRFHAFNYLLIKQLMYTFATTYDSLLAVAMSRALFFFSSSLGGHLSTGPNLPIADHSLYVAHRQMAVRRVGDENLDAYVDSL